MQLKYYKRSTIMIGIITVASVVTMIVLLLNRRLWQENRFTVFGIYTIAIFVATFLYADYDLNVARRAVMKKVRQGHIALARINGGKTEKMIRDARFRSYILWDLDLTIIDNDMQSVPAHCIEKFSLEQKTIPSGHVYVTYDPDRPEEILILPNILLQQLPEYQPLVETYEAKIKTSYLNCYYNHGLILKSYKDTLAERKKAED
ncbi:MAG: hypothetical protein J5694_02475 [Erysipelotrichaceae bacterium]|nr:hypothetical protein [Erysipelotrichaceae bacterium]MBO4537713.1 hypothetical protein [Erysipelotrichaceae bacterium]